MFCVSQIKIHSYLDSVSQNRETVASFVGTISPFISNVNRNWWFNIKHIFIFISLICTLNVCFSKCFDPSLLEDLSTKKQAFNFIVFLYKTI